MSPRRPVPVNKTECCRQFGWTRYQFDLNVTAGMPVRRAARHKGEEWQVDVASVRRWLKERAAQEAARQRRLHAYLAEKQREAERIVQARWERERAQERARHAAERAWEERCRQEREERLRTRRLDRAYAACRKLAYEDYGSPEGACWPNGRPRFAHEDHPQFMADWPFVRPAWWLPPPGMMAAIQAEPECIPYGYQEPDWRQWVPPYVPGRPWPWRADKDAVPELIAVDAWTGSDATRPEQQGGDR